MPETVSKAASTRLATGAFGGFVRRDESIDTKKQPPSASKKRDDKPHTDQQSALSHLIQGAVLIGVLVLLFVLAGFRG